jgi:hypothetical protein
VWAVAEATPVLKGCGSVADVVAKAPLITATSALAAAAIAAPWLAFPLAILRFYNAGRHDRGKNCARAKAE